MICLFNFIVVFIYLLKCKCCRHRKGPDSWPPRTRDQNERVRPSKWWRIVPAYELARPTYILDDYIALHPLLLLVAILHECRERKVVVAVQDGLFCCWMRCFGSPNRNLGNHAALSLLVENGVDDTNEARVSSDSTTELSGLMVIVMVD